MVGVLLIRGLLSSDSMIRTSKSTPYHLGVRVIKSELYLGSTVKLSSVILPALLGPLAKQIIARLLQSGSSCAGSAETRGFFMSV